MRFGALDPKTQQPKVTDFQLKKDDYGISDVKILGKD
jgi:hypothetical protein